ncbi:MAG: hypothetical protein OXH38_02310 [Chloroflexi bacterium]|nr:hypothetical protein [Chloroflexota bacterium]
MRGFGISAPRSGGSADHTSRNLVTRVDRSAQAEVDPAGVEPLLAEGFDQRGHGPRVHRHAADQSAGETELRRAFGRVDDVVDLDRVLAVEEGGDRAFDGLRGHAVAPQRAATW